ncbi:MAG: hypothetical protein ACREVQ_16790 [Burkholderiales bacterium]
MTKVSMRPDPAILRARGARVPSDGDERFRIAFLVERDGEAAALAWVKRTLGIYRRAVLDRGHFASTPVYRRLFLASCADFRRWLSTRALSC